jgi:hypothetical protein
MFYFDVRDGDRQFIDEVGTDLKGQLGLARAEALGTLIEYIKGISPNSGRRRVAVEVRSHGGEPVLEAEIMLNVKNRRQVANSRPTTLETAQRHFDEGQVRLSRQRALIMRLSQGGLPTSHAEDLLALFETVQQTRARHMQQLLRCSA